MNRNDTEVFRLRRFVEELVEAGECERRDAPVDLIDLGAAFDCNAKAVWFRAAGPERAQLVGNVMGSRRRLALALGTDSQGFPAKLRDGIEHPIPPVEVTASEAPVQEVVLTGSEADFTKLPVHLQHALDGAPYISAGIDFARDPATGMTNIGCRRLMLRGSKSAGIDLNAPSDLRAVYQRAAANGETLPLAFAVGSHPADFLAAQAVTPPIDEVHVMGGVRGAPVPMVQCATVDLKVPADAELVLEGYLDARGLVEPEGPYGEYIGYYGMLKRNPVFHLTAITKRRDALFQTVTIGGRLIGRTDTANLGAARTEAAVWSVLRQAIREPVAVCATGSSGGMYNVRISIKQRYPGESRNAIAAVFCSTADVKHVIVVDEDVDVFSDEQVDWAFATRFQADRDLVVASGFRAVPLDPSLVGNRTGAKAGFDCTKPFGKARDFAFEVPLPPQLPEAPRRAVAAVPGAGPATDLDLMTALNTLLQPPEAPRRTVEAVLAEGPATYLDLMAALGTRDGREILLVLEKLYAAGKLGRLEDGRYVLAAKSDQSG